MINYPEYLFSFEGMAIEKWSCSFFLSAFLFLSASSASIYSPLSGLFRRKFFINNSHAHSFANIFLIN
jgi:hypothetical protein